jgi:DNA-binding NtrC family response regulator
VITAHGSINVAVEAMRAGAHDFLVKPFNAERLLVTVRNALKHRSLSAIVKKITDVSRDSYFGFIGSSLAMQAVYRTVDAAATSKATVFITGESGTGKEVAAEAIHRQSTRKNGPFVAINCGAILRPCERRLYWGTRGSRRRGVPGLRRHFVSR